VRKLVLLLLVVAACRRNTSGGDATTGASSPRAAVDTYLRAVRAQDLQALAAVWGSAKGPARATMRREELEQREVIILCFFRHDASRIASDAPSTGGKRTFQVELRRGDVTRSTPFTTVQGPKERWYVENVDIEPVRDWCGQR